MNLRYKEVGPRVNYYCGVFVSLLMLVGCAIVSFQMDFQRKDGEVVFLLFSAFTLYVMYLCYVYSSKCIYGIIDLQENRFIFGNLFFRQELSIRDVSSVRKRKFKKHSYLITIGNKKYIINSGPNVDEVEKYFGSSN